MSTLKPTILLPTYIIIRVIVNRSCVNVGCKLTNGLGEVHGVGVAEMLRCFGCMRPWILFYDMIKLTLQLRNMFCDLAPPKPLCF